MLSLFEQLSSSSMCFQVYMNEMNEWDETKIDDDETFSDTIALLMMLLGQNLETIAGTYSA